MKRTVVLLALLGVMGTAFASPQPAGGPPCAGRFHSMRRRLEHRRMEQLTVLLGLTPAQQGKVKAILSEEHTKVRQSMRRVIEQARAAHRTARHETLAKLSSVLSPEQIKKFKLLMPGRMLIMRHMGGPGVRALGLKAH